MTASAPGVVSFVTALTPIAREVGVTLPPTQAWSDRIAAIDSIDTTVLDDQAACLRSLADRLADAAGSIGDAADDLAVSWIGAAGHRAHAAVSEVHRSCDETSSRLRTSATATAAAGRGVTDLRTALHATLASVPTLVLAGRAIVELTRGDVQTNQALIAAMVQAAVTTVETALTVTESAVGEVLTVLADSTGGLGDLITGHPEEVPPAREARTDVGHGPRPTSGVDGVVGALAAAGAAAAAGVGMAAVGAAGVVAQIVDTALDGTPDGAADMPSIPSHPPAHPAEGPADLADRRAVSSPTSVPHRDAGSDGPAQAPPVPPGARTHLNLRWDDDTPEHRPDPVTPGSDSVPDPAPRSVPPPLSDPVDSPTTPDTHGRETPAAATRPGPTGRPDPDDGGGLALAGDR